MPKRLCLDCGRVASASRCARCAGADVAADPHRDPMFRVVRDALIREIGRCEVMGCGATTNLTLDFRVPWRQWLKRGGCWDDRRNLRIACRTHNSQKGDRRA